MNPLIQPEVPFILASASPRRHRLLTQLGLPHRVEVSPYEEVLPETFSSPDLVETLALEKARPIARRHPEALVLGADTVVVLEDRILGKPASEEEARRLLRLLSDRTHTVYTGIALVHQTSGREVTAHEATRVTFAPLSEEEIEAYVATGSPMDKAGAYGIQDDLGALFVRRIEGDFYNVVGLPLRRLYETLRSAFADLLRTPTLQRPA